MKVELTKDMLLYVICSKGRCDFPSKGHTCIFNCNDCDLMIRIPEEVSFNNTEFNVPDPYIFNNAKEIWVEKGYTMEDLFEALL